MINDLGGFFIDFNSRLNTKGSVFTPRMAGDEPPEPGFGKVAVSTLLKMAAAAIMGNLKGQMKVCTATVQCRWDCLPRVACQNLRRVLTIVRLQPRILAQWLLRCRALTC